MTEREFFGYRPDKRWFGLFAVLGVKDTDGVAIAADGRLEATFGRMRVETSVDNVDHTEVTGPHRWWTAVGARLSAADSGLTFGTNHHKGLCIAFVEPIPKVLGFRDHAALWVSVREPAALAAAIDRAKDGLA